ncbi:cupin domain-containing protein [Ruminococcaceae bacterium OttesenSCG-928-A16]|nr:cupin domain-containing protein [Ruminococcaceae bacterium OttesenSCG-928-A16]
MEKVYKFQQSAEKLIEKILDDDVAMINHMILNQNEALPQHYSNSNVYMIIVRGCITAQLGENPPKRYEHGNLLNIPGQIKMNISNQDVEQAEFFVVKAPSPRLYK